MKTEQLQKFYDMAEPRSEEAIRKAEKRKTKRKDKELLLQDLCARLPYEVKCEIGGLRHGPYTFTGNDVEDLIAGRMFKPYLRPMSSMTKEEKKEYQSLCVIYSEHDADDNITYYYFDTVESFDWLNKKMFDYQGLIPKDLAISTKEFNPYKK